MHKLIHCMFNDLGLLKPQNTIISRYFLGTDDKRFKPKSASACGCRKFQTSMQNMIVFLIDASLYCKILSYNVV